MSMDPAFTQFDTVRVFRNQLVHPKFIPIHANELTQDQLLRRANVEEAEWFFGQVCQMAVALYTAFGKRPELDIIAEAAAAPAVRPAQL